MGAFVSSALRVPPGDAAWTPDFCDKSAIFWPLLPAARAFASFSAWPEVEDCDRLLAPRAGVRFRAQPKAPRRGGRKGKGASPYDEAICEQGYVPTRPRNWHDFFNALVWATWPRSKRALHARQLAAQRARPGGISGPRTREQDGLALLDEGGVVLLCDEAARERALAALEARDEARVASLARGGDLLGVVFGHAIYEHLARGGPAPRATVHVVASRARPRAGREAVSLADAQLASALAEPSEPRAFSDPSSFRSLPVLPELLGAPVLADAHAVMARPGLV